MTLIRRCLSIGAPVVRAHVAALALGFGLSGLPSAAQGQAAGTLDPALIGQIDTWGDAQSKQVADYLRSHLEPMLTGQEDAIARARTAVLAPFGTAGVSESFIRQYASAVSRELAPVVQAQVVQVRVNGMILAARLPGSSALNPVVAGIQDADAGVRYIAAVALGRLVKQDLVAQDQRGRIIELVDQQMAIETSSFVAGPLFEVMLDAQAFDRLLERLNGRVGWHVGRAHVGFASEAAALRGLFSRLFVGDGTPAQLKQLSRASVRYLWLAAKQLEAGNVANPASHVEMIRVAQTALTSTRERLGSSEPAPPGVVAPLTQQRWSDIVQIAARWVELLQAAPVNLTTQELAVISPSPAAEPAEGDAAKAGAAE